MQGAAFHAEVHTANASAGIAVPIYLSGLTTAYTLSANEYLEVWFAALVAASGGDGLLYTGTNNTPVTGSTILRGTFVANGGITLRFKPPHVGKAGETLWVQSPVGVTDVVIKGVVRYDGGLVGIPKPPWKV